jgi:hypothetical protein
MGSLTSGCVCLCPCMNVYMRVFYGCLPNLFAPNEIWVGGIDVSQLDGDEVRYHLLGWYHALLE